MDSRDLLPTWTDAELAIYFRGYCAASGNMNPSDAIVTAGVMMAKLAIQVNKTNAKGE